FDPTQDSVADPLGPFGSFRCTDFGVRCDGANLSRTPATYDECEPRGDSYLWDPSHYVDFLRGLKPDPGKLVVSVIAAPTTPFVVDVDAYGKPCLQESCTRVIDGSMAAPAVRLAWLASQFGENGVTQSICDDDLSSAIAFIGGTVRSTIINWQ